MCSCRRRRRHPSMNCFGCRCVVLPTSLPPPSRACCCRCVACHNCCCSCCCCRYRALPSAAVVAAAAHTSCKNRASSVDFILIFIFRIFIKEAGNVALFFCDFHIIYDIFIGIYVYMDPCLTYNFISFLVSFSAAIFMTD